MLHHFGHVNAHSTPTTTDSTFSTEIGTASVAMQPLCGKGAHPAPLPSLRQGTQGNPLPKTTGAHEQQ